MLAGSASTNPVLFGVAVFLIPGWRVAWLIGFDRWLLPLIRTPWQWWSPSREPTGGRGPS